MGHGVSRAETGRGDPEEWQVGAKEARLARELVAVEVSDLIIRSDLTGSKDYLGLRIRNLAEAERAEDALVAHAASLEVSAAAAAYAVRLQLKTPVYIARIREKLRRV